jgi:hypothetical protein
MPTALWTEETERHMRTAGWEPSRNIADRVEHWVSELAKTDGFEIFDSAQQALERFGGLEVDVSGPGLNRARMSFSLDPLLAIGEGDRFAHFARRIGFALFPLGEVAHGHAFLGIAADGRVFIVGDDLIEVGKSMEDAIDALITGRRGQGAGVIA